MCLFMNSFAFLIREQIGVEDLRGILLKRTRFTSPFVASMVHCNLNWIPRYYLVAKNFWLALWAHLCTRTLQPRRDVFRAHFLYSLVMTWKKILTDIFTLVLNFLNVEKILAFKDTTYAVEERKPAENEKFRLAGLRAPTSAIPMQCSNQHVLHCHWTVSITSHILYFTSSNLPCTYSEHFQ